MADRESSLSGESHKENRGIRPPKSKGKGRAVRVDTDDEDPEERVENQDPASEEDTDNSDNDEPAGSPKGHKRARANTGGESRPVKSESKGKGKVTPKALFRDTDGYVSGSIMRIQLRNFVTYDYVEFRPGPHLNMVLGPNGTGKSSIACAICLGLNFPPALLGRQDLKSFVKQTKDKGHIEIELKGSPGSGNITIRRDLTQASRSSTFTINGKAASAKEVDACISKLNIQVSNLCTFLPQDRVAEFARMSPQQLLRETERAAGDENLSTWHDSLISSGKELKNIQEIINAEREQLKTAQERNAALENEVKRYEERQALERRLILLELILPAVEYLQAAEAYRKLKTQRTTLLGVLSDLRKKHAPMLNLKKEFEDREKKAMNARKDKAQISKNTHVLMKNKANEYEALNDKQEDAYENLKRLKKEEGERLKKLKDLEKQVVKLEHEKANPPKHEDPKAVEEELAKARGKMTKLRADVDKLHYDQTKNVEEEATIKRKVEQYNTELQRFDNEASQKLENLRRMDADCAAAVQWLRINQHRFRLPIIEPAAMSMTIPNPRDAHLIETLFQGTQIKTFVAQCDEDYKLLMRFIVDTDEALGRKARITGWYRAKVNGQQPPLTRDELQAANFDGYAMDRIECPDQLRWFLEREVKLHCVPIAPDPRTADTDRVTTKISNCGGGSFIVGQTLHSVTQSRYGKRLASSVTREIGSARYFKKAEVDPTIRARIQGSIEEANNQLSVVKDVINKLREDETSLLDDQKGIKKQIEALNVRKEKIAEILRKAVTISARLEQVQRKLEILRNAPTAEAERERIKKLIDSYTVNKLKVTKDYLKLVQRWESELEDAVRAGLRSLQYTSDKENLDRLCATSQLEIEEALRNLSTVDHKYKAAKLESRQKLDLSRDKLDAAAPDIRADMKELEDSGALNQMEADKVMAEMQGVNAELEMNLATNKNVIEQFQRRKEEIETLTAALARREAKSERIEQAIKTARDGWEPALRSLVDDIGEKFSLAFDRIGCAGEIRITPADDYDKWAIDILVKFRDKEQLQLLTGQRQSGGERSLTTILYLMSLTEQARSPFSLVDEINQGMDQRAERAVHNQLVDVTCNSDVGQYFLITPKLLPNLMYHERMKMLCVNNGEWLDESNDVGNMMAMIQASEKRTAQSRGT